MPKPLKDLKGQIFGDLTVVEQTESKNGQRMWRCLCICGREKIKSSGVLTNMRGVKCCCNIISWRHRQQLPFGQSAKNLMYSAYKKRGKILGFDFTKEEFEKITSSNCYYCGDPPKSSFRGRNGNYTYNGVDRVNNELGYLKSNCVPCCEQCNRMKLDYTLQEFREQIIKLYFNFATDELS